MTKDDLEKAIEIVEEAKERAVRIAAGAPYFKCISEPEWVRVEIDGETALLHICSAETAWDAPVFETEECEFPSRLLFVSEDELAAWKDEERRAYDLELERKREARLAEEEAKDRAAFEKLKKKFEPNS